MIVTLREIQRARFHIVSVGIAPYYAPYLFNAQYIELEKPPIPGFTFSSDKYGNVYYSKEIPWDNPDAIVAALIHEAGHFMYRHFDRGLLNNLINAYGGDEETLNIAGDLVINQHPAVMEAIRSGAIDNILIPENQDPPMLTGQTLEYYYAEVMKRSRQQEKNGGKTGQGSEDSPEKGAGSQAPGHSQGCGSGKCGSIAGNTPQPWETGPKKTGAEIETVRREIAKEMVKHAKSHGIGTIPAGMLRTCEEILNPKTPWYKLLQDAVSGYEGVRRGRHTETWNRIKIRYSTAGKYYTPGRIDVIPVVVGILDTSGSMDKKDLGIGVAEIRNMLKTTGRPIPFITCDTKATLGELTINPAKKLELRGGGGTDMSAAFEMALRLKPAPTTIVLLTDGEIPALTFPENMKKFNLVTLVINKDKELRPPVPVWAKVINVSPEEYESRAKSRQTDIER